MLDSFNHRKQPVFVLGFRAPVLKLHLVGEQLTILFNHNRPKAAIRALRLAA